MSYLYIETGHRSLGCSSSWWWATPQGHAPYFNVKMILPSLRPSHDDEQPMGTCALFQCKDHIAKSETIFIFLMGKHILVRWYLYTERTQIWDQHSGQWMLGVCGIEQYNCGKIGVYLAPHHLSWWCGQVGGAKPLSEPMLEYCYLDL